MNITFVRHSVPKVAFPAAAFNKLHFGSTKSITAHNAAHALHVLSSKFKYKQSIAQSGRTINLQTN